MYVDDIVLTVNDGEEIQRLKNYLVNEFEIKDFGCLKCLFSIEVTRSKHGIFLYQWKYILDFLKETRMLKCKAIDNPIE